jgi:hypothetical protein
MRYSATILFMLLSSGLTAQTSAGGSSAVLTVPPASEACPINFSASRKAVGSVMLAKGAAAPHQGQGLQFNFVGSDESKVVKAEITVHGISGQTRVLPASSATEQDSTETFTLRSENGQVLLHSSVWLNRLNGVSWTELTNIEFANGTVWHASSTSRCSAIPSRTLLIAGLRK